MVTDHGQIILYEEKKNTWADAAKGLHIGKNGKWFASNKADFISEHIKCKNCDQNIWGNGRGDPLQQFRLRFVPMFGRYSGFQATLAEPSQAAQQRRHEEPRGQQNNCCSCNTGKLRFFAEEINNIWGEILVACNAWALPKSTSCSERLKILKIFKIPNYNILKPTKLLEWTCPFVFWCDGISSTCPRPALILGKRV